MAHLRAPTLFAVILCAALHLAHLPPAWATSDADGADEAPSERVFDAPQFIEGLIRQGQIGQADTLLQAVREAGDESDQILFLSGLVAAQLGRHSEAIGFFRRVLGRDPKLLRVRLELARAFFQVKDDENAKRNFELVLSENLPPNVKDNIARFLDEIRRRRATRYSFGFVLTPSTNINQAPNIRTVRLFGLPFRLDDAARQKTGVGAVTRASVERFEKLSENVRLRVGARIIHTDYAKRRFDDSFASVHVGPQFLRGASEHSLLAGISNRYFGGKFFSQTRQFTVESNWVRGNRTQLKNTLGFGRTIFNGRPLQNSNFAFIAPSITRVLNSFSLVRFSTSLRRENARSDVFGQTSWSFAAAYQRDFRLGITVVAEPRFSRRSFQARQVAFSATRFDTLRGISVSVLKRDLRVLGFAPQFTLDYARNSSTVDLFAYTRVQALFGVTRNF